MKVGIAANGYDAYLAGTPLEFEVAANSADDQHIAAGREGRVAADTFVYLDSPNVAGIQIAAHPAKNNLSVKAFGAGIPVNLLDGQNFTAGGVKVTTYGAKVCHGNVVNRHVAIHALHLYQPIELSSA